jgi:putative tricarboxylic transport membrane protein
MRDLAERLVKDPESFVIGVSNKGGTNHLTLGLVAKSAGVDPKRLKIVVFRSNAESITAVLGGHIQMVASTVTSVFGQVSDGNARFIGFGAPRRMPGVLASVPTLREQGFDISLSNWRSIMGPKGLAPESVAFWEEALSRAVAAEDWKKILETQFWEGHFLRSVEFQKYLAQQYDLTRGIMTDLGLAK